MGKINVGRLILGGVIAGVVLNLLGYLVDGVWLAPRWSGEMKALGHAEFSLCQWTWLIVLGFVVGFVAIWIYVAIRPRFGPGVKTACCAGAAVWIVGSLAPNASFMYVPHLFSRHLTLYTTLGALVELVVATIAGAAPYKES